MPQLVNLDALIPREDFEVRTEREPPSVVTTTFKATDFSPDSFTYQLLRKPDFQRETSNWTPEKVAELVQSFLEGDLIPSIILWRSPDSGNIFVIDGAHRLSALIAWVHDDYGDGKISRQFYNNVIPPEQVQAAERTRKSIGQSIGSYEAIQSAAQFPKTSPSEHVRLAKNAGFVAVQLQWVMGDAKRAEASYFNINQKPTPIDPTELAIIKSREKPNAVAARALLRSGVGHKYWSRFPDETQREIEKLAKEIYDALFVPNLETPIKTLDLPVAGLEFPTNSERGVKGYAACSYSTGDR